MTEQTPKESTNGVESTGGNAEETIFNSEIGDDWGEAFEAEDFMFSPDSEESSEFFLDDDSFDDAPSPAEDSHDISPQQDGATHPQAKSTLAQSAILGQILALVSIIKTKFNGASLPTRLATLAIPLIACILTIYLFSGIQESEQLEQSAMRTAEDINNAPTEKPPPLSPKEIKKEEQASSLEKTDKETIVEKVRKKWRLPSFLISANTQDSSKKIPAFVVVDITFVLLLPPDDLIPESQEFFVREIIYQFFNNRPLSELQRYSLARGEMNRKLRAWIEKQWPEIPLSSIAFDRYQVL